jgi:hypothetical protein
MMTCHDPARRESVRTCRTGLEECQVFPAFFTSSLYDFFLKLHAQGTTPDDKITLICKVTILTNRISFVLSLISILLRIMLRLWRILRDV